MTPKAPRGLKILGVLLLGLSLLVICALSFLNYCNSVWECHLGGPYHGVPYEGPFENEALSHVLLPSGGDLQIHHAVGTNALVLSRHLPDGTRVWARLIVAQKVYHDGFIQVIDIRVVKLRAVKQYKSGFKVEFSGTWAPGGDENGIIYVAPDYSFVSFALDST
jgi:hypothetical protein